MKRSVVKIDARLIRRIRRIPLRIKDKVQVWATYVEKVGIAETRKLPGYHDEPLHGVREGQRSVRMNQQWRVIYIETETRDLIVIEVCEVTPHDY